MPRKKNAVKVTELKAVISAAVKAKAVTAFAVGGVGGLALRIDGRKTPPTCKWWLRLRGQGKASVILGDYPAVSMEAARDAARKEIAAAKAVGMTVSEARRTAKAAKAAAEAEAKRRANMLTVAGVLEAYQAEATEINPKYAKRAANERSLFRVNIAPVMTDSGKEFGDLPIDAIGAREVFKVLEAVTLAGKSAGMIDLIRATLSHIFKKAIRLGLIVHNPMKGEEFENLKEALPKPLRETKHHGAASDAILPAFIRAVCEDIAESDTGVRDSAAARALLLAILTNSRQENAREARRDQIAGDAWTIAAKEMKVGKNGAHVVYLAPEAVELINAQTALTDSPLIFPAPRSGSILRGNMISHVMDRLNEKHCKETGKPWLDDKATVTEGKEVKATPHGIARSTFRTWSKKARDPKTGEKFDYDAAELNMHHQINRDGMGDTYDRDDAADERRRLSAAWAKFCLSETPPELWAKVVRKPLTGAEAPKAVGDECPSPAQAANESADDEEARLFGMYGG